MTSPLIDHLSIQSQRNRDELAIIDGKRTVTFAELETLTKRWAARFDQLDIGAQDPVLVLNMELDSIRWQLFALISI